MSSNEKIENAQAAMSEVMTVVSGGARIKDQMDAIEARMKWIACPWCGEEWMRLYQGLCRDCNRDVRGFRKAQERMPISGAEIKIEIKSWARAIANDNRTPECFFAIIVTGLGMRKFFAEVNTHLTMPINIRSEIESENASETDDGTGRARLLNYHGSVLSAWQALRKYLDPHGYDTPAERKPYVDEPPPF